MTKEYILNILKENHTLLERRYAVDSIGLFGSYAKGIANEKSDIDFYVVFKKKNTRQYDRTMALSRKGV